MREGFHPRDFEVNHEIREERVAQIWLEARQLQPFQSPNRTTLARREILPGAHSTE
jgi:hypothetical protein